MPRYARAAFQNLDMPDRRDAGRHHYSKRAARLSGRTWGAIVLTAFIPRPITEEVAKPSVDRADAHRRAVITFIDYTDHPHYVHPLFWAPSVVVGERGPALH